MQEEIFRFLNEPAAYPGDVGAVERLDTHGAVIFLAGDFAYKVKRSVKLGYLDYSTLPKRHDMCQREVEINRLTAPDIYIDVVPVVRTADGQLALGGQGENGSPVEWLVRMRRFDQDALFSHIAKTGGLSNERVHLLADRIAEFHREAAAEETSQGYRKMARIIDSLGHSFAGAPEVLTGEAAQAYVSNLHRAAEEKKPLLVDRGQKRYIRRCHGDMHLQNIVLINEIPTLFDAIEFDDDIATIDILYDLAFLLMDLRFHGLEAQACHLLNEYLRSLGDEENLSGLGLLPLFFSCRAAIRAMVGIDRLPYADPESAAGNVSEIREYFAVAQEFLKPPDPVLLLVGGISGTGKSTLARALSPQILPAPGAVHLRSDVERKTLFGVAPEVKLGPECYAEKYSTEVYNRLFDKAARILDAGHSVIVDAVFLSPEHRRQFSRLTKNRPIDCKTLWLQARKDKLLERVAARQFDASDADTEVVESQLMVKTEPDDWTTVDAGGDPDAVLKRACNALGL